MSGVLVGSNPYLKQIPSLNTDLFRLKLYLFNGKALSQLEAPFAEARSIAFLYVRQGVHEVFFLLVCSISFQFFDFRTNFFLLCYCCNGILRFQY